MFFLNQEINLATTSNPKSKSMNIKKKKKKAWTSSNQRTSTRANTGKPHPNPAKHPTHPLPNQTIVKEILNTTTS